MEIKIQVMLEGSRKGDVISSRPNDRDFSALYRHGSIFACGADEVEHLSVKYNKVLDRAYFDNGRAIRELVYRRSNRTL